MHELGVDGTGDDAVWVWLIVRDEVVRDPVRLAALWPFRAVLAEQLEIAGLSYFVYLNVRSVSDQAELLAGVHE